MCRLAFFRETPQTDSKLSLFFRQRLCHGINPNVFTFSHKNHRRQLRTRERNFVTAMKIRRRKNVVKRAIATHLVHRQIGEFNRVTKEDLAENKLEKAFKS